MRSSSARRRTVSGIAPASPYDWIATARQLPSGEEQPNVIVVLAGANDLKPIDDPAGRAEVLDERWRELYGRRFEEFLLALKLHGRPVVVAGLPPVEDEARNEQIAQLNALLKEQVERAGFIFVDVTDGFVDENGKFMTSGPAVDGQRRRLRNADGVGFTRAGARKLAFFVDQQLDDLMHREDAPTAATDPADTRPSIIQLTGGTAGSARTLAGAPAAPAASGEGCPEGHRACRPGSAEARAGQSAGQRRDAAWCGRAYRRFPLARRAAGRRDRAARPARCRRRSCRARRRAPRRACRPLPRIPRRVPARARRRPRNRRRLRADRASLR